MLRTSCALNRRKRVARSSAASSGSRPQLGSRATMSASSAASREVPATAADRRKASDAGPSAQEGALGAGADANRARRHPRPALVVLVLDRDLTRCHQEMPVNLAT